MSRSRWYNVLIALPLCALLWTAPICSAAPGGAGAATMADRDPLAAARTAVEANPGNAPAHAHLGFALLSAGSLDEAMRQFDQALQINPRAYDAKTGRGAVLSKMGKLAEAEQVLKGALQLNPNPVRTHYELGLVYQKLGAYDKAVAQFKEGIKKHEQGRN
jgi:tetratricopeptide (TPR) repeat protein